MNDNLIDYLWGTDPKRARFNALSRSFSFTTQPGLVTLVLVLYRGKAGSAESFVVSDPFLTSGSDGHPEL